MFNHFLDVNLALLDMVWDAGYHFDAIMLARRHGLQAATSSSR